MSYAFETRYFALSDDKLHWLRDRYDYKQVTFDRIRSAEIKKGPAIHNRQLVLLFGIALIGFAVYWVSSLVDFFTTPGHKRIEINAIVLPLLPLLLGLYCIYVSMKQTLVVKFIYDASKSDTFPLTEIQKQEQLAALRSFLKQKFADRFEDKTF